MISVSGNAVLMFADGSRRRLQDDAGAGIFDDPAGESESRESEFKLKVKLTNAGVEDSAFATSPAERLSGAVLPALGAFFAVVLSFCSRLF